MGRRKRHLRLYSIIFNVNEKRFHFGFDLNEKMIDSFKERSKKINEIRLLLDDKNMENIENAETKLVPDSNLDSESNDKKPEKINSSTKVNTNNACEDNAVHKEIANDVNNEDSILKWQSFYDADDDFDIECQLDLDDIETSFESNYFFL